MTIEAQIANLKPFRQRRMAMLALAGVRFVQHDSRYGFLTWRAKFPHQMDESGRTLEDCVDYAWRAAVRRGDIEP